MDCEFSQILEIISTASDVVFTALGAFVAYYAYKWNREKTKVDIIRFFSEQCWNYNALVLSDSNLQKAEAGAHPWGKISQQDVVPMFRQFMLLNTYQILCEGYNRGIIDQETFDSSLNNLANRTYDDRDFIKKNVLPRGYPNSYRHELIRRWEMIDREGALKPA